MKKFILSVLGVITAVIAALWAGLKVKPKPLPPYPENTPPLVTIDLPQGLPLPVARYVKVALGNRLPVIESAVLTGRGTLRFMGVTFPARFRFTHVSGQDYRHYIEATLFGFPLMKVNEYYLGGNGRLELPFGVIEDEPKINMAANLGLWAESIWLAAIYFTDSRVRWEPVDDNSARLFVPFGQETDSFLVTFDPQTGLIQTMEAMRYRDVADEEKILWRNEAIRWERIQDMMIPVSASVTWMDQGIPWLIVNIEEAVYNVDVREYIKASGP